MQTTNLFAGGFGFSKYLPLVGTKVPDYMRAANVDYLSKFMGHQPQKRVIREVNIDPSLIKDGDLLLARRMDGMDPFYMVTSGSYAAHAAVAVRDSNNELFVLEA